MASLPGCESQGGIPFEPYSTGADVAARGAPMGGQVGNDDDDAPPSSPLQCNNDLGAAQDFSVFAFGDYTGGVDVAGKIAVGGTLDMRSFNAAHQAGGGDVLFANHLKLANGAVHGNAFYGSTIEQNLSVTFHGGSPKPGAPIDFDAAQVEICGLSETLFELAPNGTTQVDYQGDCANIHFTGTSPFANVFQISAADLANAKGIFIDAPNACSIVVNVVGELPKMANYAVFFSDGTSFEKVLFNMPQATQLDIVGFDVRGSIIACNADVSFPNGQMNGTIVARNLHGLGEFHIHPFEGSLP